MHGTRNRHKILKAVDTLRAKPPQVSPALLDDVVPPAIPLELAGESFESPEDVESALDPVDRPPPFITA